MKEVLRRLLEAEQAGRQAATQLEDQAAELLRRAQQQSEQVRREAHTAMARQIEELRRRTQQEIEAAQQTIRRDTDAAIERLQARIAERRAQAVASVMALLLAEAPGEQHG